MMLIAPCLFRRPFLAPWNVSYVIRIPALNSPGMASLGYSELSGFCLSGVRNAAYCTVLHRQGNVEEIPSRNSTVMLIYSFIPIKGFPLPSVVGHLLSQLCLLSRSVVNIVLYHVMCSNYFYRLVECYSISVMSVTVCHFVSVLCFYPQNVVCFLTSPLSRSLLSVRIVFLE